MNSGFISEKIGANGASSQRSCRAGLTNNRGLLRARNRARRRRPPRSTPSRQEACLKAEGASEARTSVCTCGHDISRRQPELAFKEASLSDRCQGRMRRSAGPLPTPISFPPQGLSARRKFKNKTTQNPPPPRPQAPSLSLPEAEKHVHEGLSQQCQLRAGTSGRGQIGPHLAEPTQLTSNTSFPLKQGGEKHVLRNC